MNHLNFKMRNVFLFILLFLSAAAAQNLKTKNNPAPLIPMPDSVEWLKGKFLLSDQTNFTCQPGKLQSYFVDRVNELIGINLKANTRSQARSRIIFNIDGSLIGRGKEFYSLSVSENKIEITALTEEGLFRGSQTLFQLISPSAKSKKDGSPVDITCCKIIDKPKFKWRGLNLDCARHFMSKDFIKRYIDIISYYKMNVLHLHLTDDQGWRIEIKKYPKLTQIGAWRKEADGSTYEGFYTQDDIKEIVAYAQSRFVTIVPEIEMPGHCLAALASYPENSCTGGPFEVINKWGVFDDVYCAGKDSTFIFLESILDEVIKLFPGKYIHIGGDEVPKDRWSKCPRCQARIKAEGLKDEEGLQSYFVKRISNYLNLKGKEVIGWDEILQGGLADGAIVESWQGMNGAALAAKQKHYTISSTYAYTYLSSDVENLDLRIAYSFEPVPKDIPNDQTKFVMGGEASLWTEETLQNEVDGKLFPRLLALSEVFWCAAGKKDYDEFHSRVQNSYEDLKALGIQYGQEAKAISFSTSYDELKKEFIVNVTPGQKEIDIRYTLDGSEPNLSSLSYIGPIEATDQTELKIYAFLNGSFTGKKIELSFEDNKAIKAKLSLANRYNDMYMACGENTLIDGIRGSNDFHDGLWQGFNGVDFEGVIDLGSEKAISEVSPRFLQDMKAWIFMPASVEIALSNDGVNYFRKKIIENNIPQNDSLVVLKDFQASFNNDKARYIKVIGRGIKKCPPWHTGAGQDAWLFIDEIEVK